MIRPPQTIQIQDKLYAVYRIISETKEIDVKWFKYKLGCEKVFRSQGNYYFVDEIQEVEHINDGQLELEFPN